MAYIPFNLLNRNMHAVSIYLIFVEKNVNLHCSTITKKMSFLQTLISLRPSKICPNVNFPRFRCPSECTFSLPGQVHSYFVRPSTKYRVHQASYSVPISINNFSTLRRWCWKKPKLTISQINIALTLGVNKEVYVKENDQI